MNLENILTLKQLPIVEENLEPIKTQVLEQIEYAKSLECTEETRQIVKKNRAETNKVHALLDDTWKQFKQAYMADFNSIEAIYKDCVTEPFKEADSIFKSKIDIVENTLRNSKKQELVDYFNECKGADLNLEFIKFDDLKLNITLSTSVVSLKKEIIEFLEKVSSDLKLIDTQDYSSEILDEYYKTFNVNQAITTIVDRHLKIEEIEKSRQNSLLAKQETEERINKIEEIIVTKAPIIEEPKLTLSFKVIATKTKLQELKQFLINGGYDYE